jgi:hypothetical protein
MMVSAGDFGYIPAFAIHSSFPHPIAFSFPFQFRVVFVSYLGSKVCFASFLLKISCNPLQGNRARWIGGGCTLIAIANMVIIFIEWHQSTPHFQSPSPILILQLISASNFLFPVEQVTLNTSTLEREIERDTRRLPAIIGFHNFLAELPSEHLRQQARMKARRKRRSK